MIDPSKVALFIPPELKKFKLKLFERIGGSIETLGGQIVRHSETKLDALPDAIVPIIGCSPQLRPYILKWREWRRPFIYWDRGYYDRVFATWLPRGENGGKYRWHFNSFQLQRLRDVPSDRLDAKRPPVKPWQTQGKHIVVAIPTPTYSRFHGLGDWTDQTIAELAKVTDRKIVLRDKESKRSLQADLEGAHALVAHGSNAAVEAVICGCPVFVHPDSAAALVGQTDLKNIETPVFPDREPWLRSLSYSHYSEAELTNGALWRLLE